MEAVIVAVGEEFTIRLKSTPATGYVWEPQTVPESLQFLGSVCEPLAVNIQPGDPVTQVFSFRAVRAGQHAITLVLKRRWEHDAIESLTLTVNVN
jgi:predicted secreted protein